MKAIYIRSEFDNLKDIIQQELDDVIIKHKAAKEDYDNEYTEYNKRSAIYKFFNEYLSYDSGLYWKCYSLRYIRGKLKDLLSKIKFAIDSNAT